MAEYDVSSLAPVTVRARFDEQGGVSKMAVAAVKSRRTASRQARRRQLIEATIKCISKRGIGSTTLGDVAKEAGLSQGIVNLHFKSKDNLFNETLRHLAEEYKTLFENTLAKSGPGAADKLLALMELDLKPSVCEQKKLAVWFGFWGEVKAMPTYRKMCNEYDLGYDLAIEQLCEAIIAEGKCEDVRAKNIAEVLSSLTNGLWLSCLISPRTWDRHTSLESVKNYLRSVFPKHY
jgi:AcrR family transcriptional regulator